jgi:hypothetical protein
VDEEQSETVSLAIVRGIAFANFNPRPGPNPEFPTAWVPMSAGSDQGNRVATVRRLAATVKDPVFDAMPGVLVSAEMFKYYNGKIYGSQRLMEGQAVGSESPWVKKLSLRGGRGRASVRSFRNEPFSACGDIEV